MRTFSVFNVRGLHPSSVPSKVPYVSDHLLEKNQLFIGLTETWLGSHKDAELKIDGYKLFRSDRKRRKRCKRGRLSGGVAAYVHNDMAHQMEEKLKFTNGVVEVLGLYSSVENLFIGIVYRQPDDLIGGNRSTITEFKPALEKLQQAIDDMGDPSPNILVVGDFNLPNSSWIDELKSVSGEKEVFDSMTEFINANFLKQYINSATHKDGNTLDLVFTNNAHLIHSYNCHIPSLSSVSDHYIVECESSISGSTTTEENDERPDRISPLDNLNFFSNDIDWDAVSNEFSETDWATTLSEHHPEEKLRLLMEKIHEVCEKHIPQRKSLNRSGKPKIPRDRRILMRKRKKISDQLKLNLSDARKAKLNRKLVNIEVSLQESHKASKSMREKKAIQAIKNNPKYFFSYTKQHSKIKSQIGPLLDNNNMYTASSKMMATILSDQYQSVFSDPLEHSIYSEKESSVDCSLSDIEFSELDIIDAIDELSNNSASGPDGVSAILLKRCKKQLCSPLYILWRNCLDLGVTPDQLKIAHIIPIFKEGHHGLAVNYRPIALTSHLIKIFEKIIRNSVVSYMDANDLFNDTQHGFRHGRSCLSQLLAHFEKIINHLEANENIDVVYLDFSKAFDKVDHHIILEKLRLMGVSGKLFSWFKSFLFDRFQSVMVNGFLSDPVYVKSGVPQGSVLGPLLFLILISDIDEEILHSFLSSFADDTRIGKSINNESDIQKLQEDLEKVFSWADQNNMKFNNDKFELIKFGLGLVLKDKSVYFGPDGSEIKAKCNVKDLGVTISSNGSFSEHINKVCDKARDMSSWVLRTFSSRSPLLMSTLWKALVQPILDYCSQLWCPTKPGQIKQLEEIQKCFTRKIKFDYNLNYWERLESMRIYSQERRRERYRILYLWKMLENMVPAIDEGSSGLVKLHPRNGRTINIPLVNNKSPRQIQKIRESSLLVHGAKLFNILPKYLRNIKNCSLLEFKNKLDGYISQIPDEPFVSGYSRSHSASSNSLIMLVPTFEKDRLLST